MERLRVERVLWHLATEGAQLGRSRTFLGAGATFIVLGCWALGFWYVANVPFFGRVGGVLVGMGLLLASAGLFFRRQGWE